MTDPLALQMTQVHARELCLWLEVVLRGEHISLARQSGPVEVPPCEEPPNAGIQNTRDLAQFLDKVSQFVHQAAEMLGDRPSH